MRIGVFIAFLNDSYQRDLWRHLTARARRAGIEVVGFCGHGLGAPVMSQATMNLAYRMAGPRSLDGLIAFSNTLGTFHGPGVVARLLEDRDLPTVSLGFDLSRVPSVSARGREALATLVRHLIRDHGRRRLALVSGPRGHLESEEREAAFLETLAAEGLVFDPALLHRGTFYTQAGREAVAAFEASGRPYDAVVCLNDHMAIGVLDGLRQRGRIVPTEVSVIGFDDILEADRVSPPLTTVRQPLEALASGALDLVLRCIEGSPVSSVVLEGRPVVRRSCGCPPVVGNRRSPDPWRADPPAEGLARAAAEGRALDFLAEALAPRWGDTQALAAWRGRVLGLSSSHREVPLPWADEALAWLADEELRWEREARLRSQERSEEVREHSVRLLGLLSLDAIVRYGEDHFPSLGIPRSFLVLFEGCPGAADPQPPARSRWLTTRLSPDRGLREVVFDTALLMPPQAEFSWGDRGWLVEPLVYQDEALGYLLLEGGTDDPFDFETLRETLSTAVKGALLMQQVLDHRQTLARQVKERTRELREAHRDLHEVAHRTMQAIGQDIHDDLCQHLVAISMLTQVAEERAAAGLGVERTALTEVRSLVDQAVVRSRQFARTLYPPGLEERGLVSAVEDLIDSLTGSRGRVTFTVEGDCRLNRPDLELQIYRILQESLSNALRHSGSEEVIVRLVRSDQGLLAEVRDFGRGPAPGALGSGMGTRILKARAETVGARLEFLRLEPGLCVSCFLAAGGF